MTQYACYPSLMDKVVVITGGAGGIGADMVTSFAENGAKVAFFDIDESAATQLIRRLSGAVKHTPVFHNVNLCDIHQLKQVFAVTSQSLGKISVLINNAARDDRHSIESVTSDYWRNCMATNLDHYFFASQTVLEDMKALGGGSIINMSSITWVAGFGNMPGYVTANAGIMGLT